MNFTGNPIVGLDATGRAVNLILDSSGNTNVAAYVDTVGGNNSAAGPTQATAWSVMEINAIKNSSTGLVGFGYGSDNISNMQNIVWINQGSGWSIAASGLQNVRSIGIAIDGSNFIVADSTNINVSALNLSSSTGGFISIPPTYTKTPAAADSVVKGPVAIAASLSSTGVWIGPNWTHQVGLSVPTQTGHYSTSYTFPGASGSDLQYQMVTAIPAGDAPPTTWGNESTASEGYYGLIGSPSFKVDWYTTL